MIKAKAMYQANAVTINSFQQRWSEHKSGADRIKSGGNAYTSAYNELANKLKPAQKYDELVRKLDKNKDVSKNFIYDKNIMSEDVRKEKSLLDVHRETQKIKSEGDTTKILLKCIKIAMRIQRGDNVPAKDDNFLFKNNPAMHLRAWSFRQEKENPEDCKSELDDEKGSASSNNYGSVSNVSFNSGSDISLDMAVEALDI